MATRRIKEITNTATTFASDDFIALDGTSQGTRKMDKDDLIAEVSAGVSGDYLEEANNLSDVASVPDSKGNLEIPDVGSSPNEVSLNGMLGSMAFQSAEAVSVAELEVTDKVDGSLGIGVTPDKPLHVGGSGEQTLRLENTDTALGDGDVVGSIEFEANDASGNGSGVVSKIQAESLNATGNLFGLSFHTGHGGSLNENMVLDNDGRLGIGADSPGSYNANANNLVVGTGSGSEGMTIASGTTGEGGIYFADGTTGNQQYRGYLGYGHTNDELFFGTEGVTKWKLNSTGNLVPQSSGLGIDFGSTNSTSGVTVTGSTLDHYEAGTWTPTVGFITAGPTAGASAAYSGKYTRIGRMVYCSIDLDFDNAATSIAVDDRWTMQGLPFSVASEIQTYTGAGSFIVYGSVASGVNALGAVGITQTADTVLFYVTHLDGTLGYENNVRAIFSYETDA
jgi:hypothetical protein